MSQVRNACFQHTYPYAYNCGERISFTDSSFHYEFVQGLVNGFVSGTYSLSGDTVTLNSEYQQDDYVLTHSFDPSIVSPSIHIIIKSIESRAMAEVRYRKDIHHLNLYPGTCIYRSQADVLDDIPDTLIHLHEVLISPEMREIEVKIWRAHSAIRIPITENANSYLLDLTSYPEIQDYVFSRIKNLSSIARICTFLQRKMSLRHATKI